MHIAIEGLDGIGKTTTCKKLAEKLGFKFVEKPLHYLFDTPESFENYFRIRDYVNAQTNHIFTSWFYGLGNIFTYHLFGNENIITDRHLVSNYTWSGDKTSEPVFECLISLIGKPDFTIILFADEEILKARLKKRNVNDRDLKKAHLNKFTLEKMEHFLQKYDMKYITIDTTHLDVEGVVNIIISNLLDKGIIKK